MLSIATEALVQRGESPLFKDLVALHERAASLIPLGSDENTVLKILNSISYTDTIVLIVKKNMGVLLNSVTVYASDQINARMVVVENRNTAKERREVKATSGIHMDQIKRLYDDKRAFLEDSDKPLPLFFNLWISTEWWTSTTNGKPTFTPREISAIILHELGHTDHFIRSIWRVYGRLQDASDVVTYIQTNRDKKAILAVISAIEKSPFLHPAWNTILQTTKKYFQTTNSFDDSSYWEALTTLSTLVAAESSQRTLNQIGKFLGNERDQVTTHLHAVDHERNPDDFAARNGAYADSVSALAKSETLWEQWKTSTFTAGFFQSVMGRFYHTFNLPAEAVGMGYDPVVRRMELFVETAKHAFHDQALPSEAKHDIIRQIQLAEKTIADFHSVPHRAMRAKIKSWTDNMRKFGRIFASPFQDRLGDDYGRLQDANRSLSRHPLFYMGR